MKKKMNMLIKIVWFVLKILLIYNLWIVNIKFYAHIVIYNWDFLKKINVQFVDKLSL